MTNSVLIVGAGIGGLAAGLALARRGIGSHIVERAPEIREVGAGIQLGPNAFAIFARLGIAKEMDRISFKPDAIRLIDSLTGEELSRQTLGQPFEQRFGQPYRVAHRADVQRVLLDGVLGYPELVKLTFGDAVAAVMPEGPSATVMLESGTRLSGPIVVGADGLWSTVRQEVMGQQPPSDWGHVAFRALVPVSDLAPHLSSNDVRLWIGPSHHVIAYKVRSGELVNVVAIIHHRSDLQGWDFEADTSVLRAAVRESCAEVRELIGAIPDWRMWPLYDRDPQSGWSRGRATLLGDAAHPMLPYLAQGACMAIEDAECLADEIAQGDGDLPASLTAYEHRRFDRTASVQVAARDTGKINHVDGAARKTRNEFLKRRKANDYESIAWLFEGSGARPADRVRDIGIFGQYSGI
jgi:3-hydroxybenzoate 6-monooxygenase